MASVARAWEANLAIDVVLADYTQARLFKGHA